jgi:phage baseplate assembly protein W
MNDIYLQWHGDLAVDSTGDLALVDDVDRANQRICRRLLTNSGDYIWQPTYGGGLAQFVGSPARTAEIESVIRTQLSFEPTVATTPAPNIDTRIADSANGYVTATISYSVAPSGTTVQLNLNSG